MILQTLKFRGRPSEILLLANHAALLADLGNLPKSCFEPQTSWLDPHHPTLIVTISFIPLPPAELYDYLDQPDHGSMDTLMTVYYRRQPKV